MIFVLFPLLDKDNHEHGGHNEFDALGAEFYHRAEQSTHCRAEYPVKLIKEGNEKLNAEIKKDKLTKEQKKELKLAGVNRKDKQAVKEYFDRQAQVKAEAEAEAKRIADEKALADRLANPTTEDLLKQIKELLEKKV